MKENENKEIKLDEMEQVNGGATVRGGASISQSSEPLYIIDGIPGVLSDINPSDIESMQVLKDAASAAIYGVRRQ